MTTPRTKAQNSEKAFRRHRQRFTARTIHAVILSSQNDPSAGAMGRFYHQSYCLRVANEAWASGDTETYALFDAHARLLFQSLMLHNAVYKARDSGDQPAFTARSLELEDLLRQIAQQPTPDRPPRPTPVDSTAPSRSAFPLQALTHGEHVTCGGHSTRSNTGGR